MPNAGDSMTGKVCLITGATSGIGAITARELARRGATVVMIGRNPEKCRATVEAISAATGHENVASLCADLSSQAEVRRVAREFLDRYSRLDVLINNAGALLAPRTESVEGIEMTFALNHLAYFLLTDLLLDRLKASAPARIVNVASDAHRAVKAIDFDDLQYRRRRYRPFRVYCQSKLANVMFTNELARRLAGTGVTANSLHPGFVATNFFVGRQPIHWLMRWAAFWVAIPPEQGAQTSIYLASSPEVEGITGQYFEKCRSVIPSRAALDESAARRLWEVSEQLVAASVIA